MTKIIAVVFLLISASQASAQHMHSNGDLPKEVGQSTFAALAEIVDKLRNDENTDWSEIDIDALRSHLVDMNNVTTLSNAATSTFDEKVVFEVTGEGSVIASIQRMAKAHAPMLANETGWSVAVENLANGATMTIIPENSEITFVRALGFYGVMTIGAHHQMHHMMIAAGHDPH